MTEPGAGRVMVECLPLACWPLTDLLTFRASIAEALAGQRVQGHDLLTALAWADLIDDELQARAKLPKLGDV